MMKSGKNYKLGALRYLLFSICSFIKQIFFKRFIYLGARGRGRNHAMSAMNHLLLLNPPTQGDISSALGK